MKHQSIRTMSLAGGSVVPFSSERGTRVRVLEGRVWVTEQGSSRDLVLSGGEEISLTTRGLAVMEAFDAAEVQLVSGAGSTLNTAHGNPKSSNSTVGQWVREGSTLESAAFLPAIVSAIALVVLVGLQELRQSPAASAVAEPLAQLNAQGGLVQRVKVQAGRTGG